MIVQMPDMPDIYPATSLIHVLAGRGSMTPPPNCYLPAAGFGAAAAILFTEVLRLLL